jgi:hypothetical protein
MQHSYLILGYSYIDIINLLLWLAYSIEYDLSEAVILFMGLKV